MLRFLQHWHTPRGCVGLSLTLNLPLALWGVHQHAFDTYVHVFLASHYQRSWFNLWEPRWYLGFSVASYPPLIHQLIALLAWPLEFLITRFAPRPEKFAGEYNLLSLEVAYGVLLLAVLGVFPLAMRAWAQIFVGPHTAKWAATLAVFLPAISLTGWAFGQLPTLAATTIILFALACGAEFLRTGQRLSLAQAVLLAGLAAALHHGVFLFVPFAGIALLPFLFKHKAGVRVGLMRFGLWAALSAIAVAVVLWPFLIWSYGQSLQTPIDHPSRYNFFQSWPATAFFFWPIHGPLLLLIPAALWLTGRTIKLWPLTVAWAALFVLSLGGTTLLPQLLFGAGWEWLTYDRFGLWAGVAFGPLAGAWLVLNFRKPRGAWKVSGFFISLVLASMASARLCVLTQCQPPAVNLAPLVTFLNEPKQKPYRYLTLGFGDQLAKLSVLVSNGTPDGTYHTARPLPELRASGLGALDGAVWNPQGVWALKPFLEQAQRYGTRWAFVNHPAYAQVLAATGWRYRFEIGTVQAWEHEDVQPITIESSPQNDWTAQWWGIVPLAVLVLSGGALGRRVQISRAQLTAGLEKVRLGLLAATLFLLNFWWVWPARPALTDFPRIYFGYESILVFASDVTVVLALGVWLVQVFIHPPRPYPKLSILLLLALAPFFLSGITAIDVGLTLATALHWCLMAGLLLMLIISPPPQRWLVVMFSAFIFLQAGWVLLQIFIQSTAVPVDWPFLWPGLVTANQAGASVVQNAEGTRWLRAYGTFSHPNVLGAMLVVFLGIVLANKQWRDIRHPSLATLVIITASASIALTFSRAAWLGLAGFLLAGWWFTPPEFRPQVKRLMAISAFIATLVLAPLSSFVISRVGVSGPANRLETASTLERTLLIQFGLQAWQASPFTGVGAGGFVQWAAQNVGIDLPFEPVHNVPLLILAETGVLGAGAALAVGGAMAYRMWRRRKKMRAPEAIYAATLLGVGITLLFDHLWWTQPPARTLLVLLIGMWVNASRAVPPPEIRTPSLVSAL